jgi:hypothetical protein
MWSPIQFSGVESAKEFLINLLMVSSQRIDVARHSNERWGAAGWPERNKSALANVLRVVRVFGVELEGFTLYGCGRCTTRDFPNWNRFKFDVLRTSNT